MLNFFGTNGGFNSFFANFDQEICLKKLCDFIPSIVNQFFGSLFNKPFKSEIKCLLNYSGIYISSFNISFFILLIVYSFFWNGEQPLAILKRQQPRPQISADRSYDPSNISGAIYYVVSIV